MEELSAEALRKMEKKPEKIVLYSNYLPVAEKLESNDTNDIDDNDFDIPDIDDDDDTAQRSTDNYFVYFLELLGSLVQLIWGGISSLFKPSS